MSTVNTAEVVKNELLMVLYGVRLFINRSDRRLMGGCERKIKTVEIPKNNPGNDTKDEVERVTWPCLIEVHLDKAMPLEYELYKGNIMHFCAFCPIHARWMGFKSLSIKESLPLRVEIIGLRYRSEDWDILSRYGISVWNGEVLQILERMAHTRTRVLGTKNWAKRVLEKIVHNGQDLSEKEKEVIRRYIDK